ncbi:MAG: patatin-like phospholipase family protein [Deltaproteobacteria bacterium]|nr:patatin-like phospholipase family protein [Deltaproteobacteria bacterium]
MSALASYAAVVFAGGGSRCFWQAGFWHAVDPELAHPPRVVTATSAGASTACHVFGGQTSQCLAFYRAAAQDKHRNIQPENLFKGGPVFPGHQTYRRALETVLAGEGLARLRQGRPQIRVLMTRPPAWSGPGLGGWLGVLAYSLEKRLVNPVHPRWTWRLGFTPLVGRIDQCASVGELADLVLAASCLPVVLPPMTWEGARVLDGGFLDNAPLAALSPEEGPVLVLLTRRYPPERLQGRPGVTYVMPSRPLAISKFENSNPDLVEATFQQGVADGEKFLAGGPAALQQ